MKNFLNRFNQKIINVKIAGSNRRRVKKNLFNFTTKYLMTDIMIAQSKLVIGHNSTALQYAILFKKPILLISCNELKKIDQIQNHLMNLKKLIDCKYFNIENFDFKKKNLFKVNKKKYNSYIIKYIKNKKSEDINFFQILKKNLIV